MSSRQSESGVLVHQRGLIVGSGRHERESDEEQEEEVAAELVVVIIVSGIGDRIWTVASPPRD